MNHDSMKSTNFSQGLFCDCRRLQIRTTILVVTPVATLLKYRRIRDWTQLNNLITRIDQPIFLFFVNARDLLIQQQQYFIKVVHMVHNLRVLSI